ncbi:M81 family metallopeptidase [Paraburkholderia bannensis]|uniref:M81 family metallopeptidase n=1 Tax=Paraburkholderia bannensis TaxID=765414 RepID=UPI002AB7EBC5|nr:M81 family metallopeptidase [Paraburkholderia bannensis]
MNRPKILVAQIFQETNGLNPLPTTLDAFQIEVGQEMLDRNRNADSTLGGMIRAAEEVGCTLVPTIAARTSPGGRVADDAFEFIAAHITRVAKEGAFDAIALDLHGCMQTATYDSSEEELVERLREIVGYDMNIAAGFDLHGHITTRLVQALNFATSYKTNPHADAAETGARAVRVLLEMCETGVRPVGYMAGVPMLTRGNDETTSGPLQRIHQMAAERIESSDGRLLDASIFNVQQFIDAADMGQKVIVYGEPGSEDACSRLSVDIANALWDCRDEVVHNLPTVKRVLTERRARGETRVLTLGDFGDRVIGGAPGDSAAILGEILHDDELTESVLCSVTDPAAVKMCKYAGVGATVLLSLGGCYSSSVKPVAVEGVVTRVREDGTFRSRGAFMGGADLRIGPHAVVKGERFAIVITNDALMSQDPGCFLDLGLDPANFDVTVAKSGYHYKLSFSATSDCVNVATPGVTMYEPEQLDLVKGRPLYPVDNFKFVPVAVQITCATSIGSPWK